MINYYDKYNTKSTFDEAFSANRPSSDVRILWMS